MDVSSVTMYPMHVRLRNTQMVASRRGILVIVNLEALLNLPQHHTCKNKLFLDKAYNAIRRIRRHTKAENENQEVSIYRCLNTVPPGNERNRSE